MQVPLNEGAILQRILLLCAGQKWCKHFDLGVD